MGLVQSEKSQQEIAAKDYVYDIFKYRENMSIECPVRDGLVSDWDALEKLWEHALSTYCGREGGNLNETPVLLAEKPYAPISSRHRCVQILTISPVQCVLLHSMIYCSYPHCSYFSYTIVYW